MFEVKQNLCHTARLVCGGHVVNANGLPTHVGMVKGGASAHSSFLIAAANNVDVLTGNIDNAFVNDETPRENMLSCRP